MPSVHQLSTSRPVLKAFCRNAVSVSLCRQQESLPKGYDLWNLPDHEDVEVAHKGATVNVVECRCCRKPSYPAIGRSRRLEFSRSFVYTVSTSSSFGPLLSSSAKHRSSSCWLQRTPQTSEWRENSRAYSTATSSDNILAKALADEINEKLTRQILASEKEKKVGMKLKQALYKPSRPSKSPPSMFTDEDIAPIQIEGNATTPLGLKLLRLLDEAYKSIKLEETVFEARRTTLGRVEELIKSCYGPQYRVELFGSTRYGVSFSTSDLDIVILDPWLPQGWKTLQGSRDRRGIYNLRTLARRLEAGGFQNVVAIPKAKVPIIKFHDPQTGLDVDINVNERLGLSNSHLIKRYCKLLPILKPTLAYIKLWAKPLGHNSPSISEGRPTFGSYAFVLMTIGFFQNIGLLPNLQSDVDQLKKMFWYHKGRQCDITFRSIDKSDWEPPVRLSLREIVYLWFKFWGTEFNYKQQIVDIKQGGIIPPILPPGTSQPQSKRTKIRVANPFLQPRNVTRNISSSSLSEFRRDCEQAMKALKLPEKALLELEKKLSRLKAGQSARRVDGDGNGFACNSVGNGNADTDAVTSDVVRSESNT